MISIRRHWQLVVPLAVAAWIGLWAYLVAGWYSVPDQPLGTLRFPISCGWRVQQDFTTATSLLHLFQFEAAEKLYRDIIDREPDCAIAYWGIAISRRGNPMYTAPGKEDQRIARDALHRADNAHIAGARERAYIAAAETLFDAPDRLSWEQREVAYSEAMGRVAADYPDDLEATIFHALALNVSGRLPDRDVSERTKAAELLLLAFSKAPDHPGISHYLAFCLVHANYQPKPYEKEPSMSPVQRISMVAVALFSLVGVGIIGAVTLHPRPSPNPATEIGGPFTLTADDGSSVTDRSFRPRWLLVYFGYTHCPDLCPTTLSALSTVLDILGPLAQDVQPLFISIDPERDDPASVHEFVKAFDPRIIGLTGSSAQIAAAARQYLVFYKKVPTQDSKDYFMDHSSYVYVMQPDGHYATLLTTDELASPADVAARLKALLKPAHES
jgi:protein SCO1/2